MEQTKTAIEVPKGLVGVIVDTSSICSVDDSTGLVYRGYNAVELGQKVPFEKAAYLMVYGKLPDDNELASFSSTLTSKSALGPEAAKVIASLPKDIAVMDAIRTVISMVPTTGKDNAEVLVELAAKFPRIISDSYRVKQGLPPLPDIQGTYAERVIYFLTGKEDKEGAKYLEKLLVMYIDHEFNASTWALRCTASTLADPKCALTTAISTLKGPLHGGANQEVITYTTTIKSKEDAEKWVDDKLAKKEKVMGFGHRVYKTSDPRAQFIKGELKTLATSKNQMQVWEAADSIEQVVWAKIQKPANVDFYAALYMNMLGIDNSLFTPVFALSRVFGWTAHYLEQVANNKLIRPDAKYIGPNGLKL